MKRLLLVELNEINFNLVNKYTKKYPKKFPNFIKLGNLNTFNTFSEFEYHLNERFCGLYIFFPCEHLPIESMALT